MLMRKETRIEEGRMTERRRNNGRRRRRKGETEKGMGNNINTERIN
jgi:hypothetical protein